MEGLESEIEYLEGFLRDLSMLPQDSKLDVLLLQIDKFLSRRDSLLVFTQYTDTMDFLREKLRLKFGSRVACYSGRGGERWTGSQWQMVPKENIKNLFREGQELSILLCTESASEGLNLQTCGVLINYDMPWNPMRVEQRIGRIDRIGQRYETVWVRNYFFEDTVEARVYQKLDERIASFTNVVGRLQPILHDVANVIRDASMAVDAEREQILRTRLDSLQRKLDDDALKDFDLDALVDASTETAVTSGIPAILPDLERVLTQGTISGVRFEPGSQEGVWNLHIGTDEFSVTFRSDLFDEFPNSLQLLTWGNPILVEIFRRAASGDEGSGKGLLSIASGDLIVWYVNENERLKAVSGISPEHPTRMWSDDQVTAVLEDFHKIEERALRARKEQVGSSRTWSRKSLEIEGKALFQSAVAYQCIESSQQGLSLDCFTMSDILEAEDLLQASGYPWKPLRNVIVGGFDEAEYEAVLREVDSLMETRRPIRADLDKLRKKAVSIVHRYSCLEKSVNSDEEGSSHSIEKPPQVRYYN